MSDTPFIKLSESTAPYRKLYLYVLVFNAALGSFFFGFSLGVFNPVQGFISRYVYPDITPTILYLATSFVPAGAAIGALSAGSMSKNYGRRCSMLVIDILSIIGVALEILPGEYFLLLGRLICGFCVGLNSALVPIYISEVSPVMVKGVTGTFNQILLSLGVVTSFVLGLGVPQDASGASSNWWRVMLGFPFITCSLRILFLLFVFKDETPKYLITNGKDALALKALKNLYKGEYAKDLFESLKRERENESTQQKTTYTDLISPKLRRRFTIGVLLSVLQQFSGINGITFYSDTIFEQESNGNVQQAQIYTAILGIIGFVSGILSSFLIRKFGRKTLLSYGCILLTIDYIAFITISYLSNGTSDNLKYCLFAYNAIFGVSLGPVVWIYLSEILPDIGVGVASLSNWVTAFLIAQGFPYLLIYFGQSWAFSVFGVSCFIGIIFCFVWVKETKGKNEVQIAQMYSNHSKIEEERNNLVASQASDNFLNTSNT